MPKTIDESSLVQLEHALFFAWGQVEKNCGPMVADELPTLEEALVSLEKREGVFGSAFVLGDILDCRKELFGDDPVALIKDLYNNHIRFLGWEDKRSRRVKRN